MKSDGLPFEFNTSSLHQQIVSHIHPPLANYPNVDRNVSQQVKPSESSEDKITESTQHRYLCEGNYIPTLQKKFPNMRCSYLRLQTKWLT